MATSEGIPSSIDIEFLELNDNPYIIRRGADRRHTPSCLSMRGQEYIEKVERVRSERARVRQEGKEILSEAERKTVP